MDLLISSHQNIGGWNTLLVVSFLIAVFYIINFIRKSKNKAWWKSKAGPRRLVIGFLVMSLGVAIRVGGWLPWRSYLDAGLIEKATEYASYSFLWTSIGISLSVIGLSVIMWGVLYEKFKDMTIPVIVGFSLFIYSLGAFFTGIH